MDISKLVERIQDVMTALALAQGIILSPTQVAAIPNISIVEQLQSYYEISDKQTKERVDAGIKKVKSNQAVMLAIAKKTGYGSGGYGKGAYGG
ncbi:MAG: hypothetical protein KME26_28430 [Oscillatoria princeps RMCB-10]|jgi:hypothetical protein|nr:hypothetical protein [Oscillatoria princeps RMCB-10]